MSGTGLLVTAWPFVLGCDAAGVVVEVGDKASSKFKVAMKSAAALVSVSLATPQVRNM